MYRQMRREDQMRIVIVDGEAQVREELEKLLKKAEPEYELAGTAADGREG